LQPSANSGQAVLEAVARDVNELERLCLEIDASINDHDWERLGAALADSRRITHSVSNAMGDATPYRTAEFDTAVFLRLQQIYAYRQERMNMLQQIHDEIGDRLRQLSRWKGYARSISGGERRTQSSLFDSRR
jgi:hypothetical protein